MKVFSLNNKFFKIQVKSFGAELRSVKSHETDIEYIWQADASVWARHAPHLFPIVGKLKDGKYTYQSNTYQLPQHGFARDNEFVCVQESEDQLVFELVSDEETLKYYPFKFKFQITYTLTNNTLTTKYSVFNLDHTPMYFSVGAHPAFNCPLQEHETFEDFELRFPNNNELLINALNDGLITHRTKQILLENNRLHVTQQLFDNDALVCMNTQIQEVSLVSRKTNHGVTLKSINWPYYGIWTKKGTNHFVCLEPWFGIADTEDANGDITKKMGIITLQKVQEFNCSFNCLFF